MRSWKDAQNGLAHFLEHMAFNGTENFPGNSISEILKKYGVSMNTHVNAQTGHNETVYYLAGIPTKEEGLIDSCLLVLHDWSRYITFDERRSTRNGKLLSKKRGQEWMWVSDKSQDDACDAEGVKIRETQHHREHGCDSEF